MPAAAEPRWGLGDGGAANAGGAAAFPPAEHRCGQRRRVPHRAAGAVVPEAPAPHRTDPLPCVPEQRPGLG